MASNYTENYQLNQWEPTDKVLREEFNENSDKIDAALGALAGEVAALPRLAVGSYTGNGAATLTISLPFRPQFALIRMKSTQDEGAYVFGDTAIFLNRETAGPRWMTDGTYFKVLQQEDGLSLVCSYTWEEGGQEVMVCNRAGQQYVYMVLG